MAASTITRTTWTNDTGTVATPNNDGTVLNNARLQDIYAAVDQVLSGAGSYTTLRFGGLIAVEGFGISEFSAGGTGANVVAVRNTTAGTANYGGLHIGNNSASDLGQLLALSSTYTPAGALFASGVILRGSGAGGLTLQALDAAGAVRVYSGGNTLRLRVGSAGEVECGDATFDTAAYGPLGVTRPATADDLVYLAFTKAATASLGQGVDASDRFWWGGADSSKTSASVYARLSSTQFLAPAGAGSTPGLASIGDSNTGMWFPGSDDVSIACAGVTTFTFRAATASRGPLAQLETGNYGTGAVEGTSFAVGRNGSGNGAAGCLVLQARSGTFYYLWVESGTLRIHTAPPTENNTTVSHTAGTVVGTQT